MAKVKTVNNKNNYISTVKAFGIIFMVIGHSQCPTLLHNIIYMFHMPLFFFCSGYFFQKLRNEKDVFPLIKKKIIGLYLPYIKWSIAFLLIHNLFFEVNIYNSTFGYLGGSHLYRWHEIFIKFINIIFTMDDHEYLLGGFWFIKILFLDTLFIGISSVFIKKEALSKNAFVVFLLVFTTALIRYVHLKDIVIIGNLATITFGATFFMIGHIFKSFEKKELYKIPYLILAIILFIISLKYYPKGLSIHCHYKETLPYTLFATTGIYITFALSRFIDKYSIRKIFYYIGQETMIILSLHFLSFKLVSLILIFANHLPINHLAEYPVLNINNGNYWFSYTITGVAIPLMIKYIYNKTKNNIQWKR